MGREKKIVDTILGGYYISQLIHNDTGPPLKTLGPLKRGKFKTEGVSRLILDKGQSDK